MSHRTYLDLRIQGEKQLLVLRGKEKLKSNPEVEIEVIKTEKFPTEIILLDNYCIGKLFFDDLPEELQPEEIRIDYKEDYAIWFLENTDNGEIKVDYLIKILENLESRPEVEEGNKDHRDWLQFKDVGLLNKLKFWISANIISPTDVVKFEAW